MPSASLGALSLGLAALLAGAAGAAGPFPAPEGAVELPLWDAAAPTPAGVTAPGPEYTEEWSGAEGNGWRVRRVTTPSLYAFIAAPERATGAALVLAPGGGFNIVMLEHEGWRVARRLAAEGLTVFVLKYRHFAPTAAFADGRRAVRLVRVRAAEWNVDPARIGLGGFSAGGRLALGVAALPEGREDRELDSLAAVSARPDFLLLVYPSPFRALGNDAVVDAGFPPSFIVGTVEDHPAARVHDLALRLRAANVRHEAHVFSAGAHGFALGEALPGTSRWPELFESWFRDQIAPSGGMKSATLTDEPAWGQPRGTRAVAPSPPEASARPPPPTP